MNVRKFATGLAAVTVGIATCALIFTASATVKNPVTRPFKISGHIDSTAYAFDQVNGLVFYHMSDTGEATHVGRYSNTGTFVLDLSTFEITGNGSSTAADGSTLEWISEGDAAAGEFTVTWTSGTRRFLGVKGSFDAFSLTSVAPAETISFDYVGAGAITY